MPIYISRGRFTSAAIKGMVAKPENREEAVAKLIKSVGGKLIGWYLTFGQTDWLVIAEYPNEKAAASAILAGGRRRQLVGHRDDRCHERERGSRYVRICLKGGEKLQECRGPLIPGASSRRNPHGCAARKSAVRKCGLFPGFARRCRPSTL